MQPQAVERQSLTAIPAARAPESAIYKKLYSFTGSPNGSDPDDIIAFSGQLYGTTLLGGSGYGTLFTASTTGSESVLNTFTKSLIETEGLTNINGMLYAESEVGGPTSYGSIETFTASGVVGDTFDFDGTDGIGPVGGLTTVNGKLYGTTVSGGANSFGTIFRISPGLLNESVIYSFPDSASAPLYTQGLISIGDTLYGSSSAGGGGDSFCGEGCGTVFRSSTSGSFHMLHVFAGGVDGEYPSKVIDGEGTLYGTTGAGGTGTCAEGCGTVFALSTSGAKRVIYDFKGGQDGSSPGGIAFLNGTLYGVTQYGGGTGCDKIGCGTVFSVSTSGMEQILHRFKGGADGANPAAPLVDIGGVFYGITPSGGGANNYGTIYSIAP
jgi:uncharacterized repeat protein (TIGR03803 family)